MKIKDGFILRSVAGQTVHTSMHQSLCRDRLFVQLLTEENQIDPNRLNDILAAVQESLRLPNLITFLRVELK